MTVGEKIRSLRIENGFTLEDIADRIKTSKQNIYKYEKGIITNIPLERLEALANVFGVSVSDLIGESAPDDVQYPVIGSISAGYGSIVYEETTDIESVPAAWVRGDSRDAFIVLKVKGNSCYPLLMEGDKILVHKVDSVDSGTLACVIYDDECATVKRVFYDRNEPTYMRLEPINTQYPPVIIEGEEALSRCRIIGKVIRQMRTY